MIHVVSDSMKVAMVILYGMKIGFNWYVKWCTRRCMLEIGCKATVTIVMETEGIGWEIETNWFNKLRNKQMSEWLTH